MKNAMFLVAAVVLFGEKGPDVAEIRQLCKEGLEGNSIPTYLQVVKEIPKTVSEKALDRVLREAFSPDAPGVFRLA